MGSLNDPKKRFCDGCYKRPGAVVIDHMVGPLLNSREAHSRLPLHLSALPLLSQHRDKTRPPLQKIHRSSC